MRPPEPAGVEGPDLRLLPGALLAWVMTAAGLGVPAWWRVGAGAALALGALAVLRGTRARTAAGVLVHGRAATRLALGLALAATALCTVAAGLQALTREAGTVRALAAAGAVVRVQGRVAVRTRGWSPPRAARPAASWCWSSCRCGRSRGAARARGCAAGCSS